MRKLDLLEGDIKKILLHYLIPSVLSMLAVSAYVFVDTAFVGYGVGSTALAALNISIPIYSVFTALHCTIGIGGGTLVSIAIGKGDEKEKNKVFSIAVIMAIIVGIILTIIGVIFPKNIASLLGATEEIKPLVSIYIGIISAVSWAFLLVGVLSAFIRNDKNPRLVMIASIVSNLANVILDYVFIFIFDLGIAGAALATAISPIINLLILSTHFLRQRGTLKFSKVAMESKIIKRIVKNGFGSFILEICGGIIIFILNNIFMKLGGELYVAAYGIIANIAFLGIAVFEGIGQSIQPVVSVNFGAKKRKRILESLKYAVILSMSFGIFIYVIFLLFPEAILKLFTKDDLQLINITAKAMRIYFFGYALMGANMVFLYFLQSIEESKMAIFISLSRGIIFVILGLIILTPAFKINGVWFSVSFSEICTFILGIFILKKDLKRNN
ncbi:MATE family efflux transporter [Clostridium ihumii]|uniref:MATE family efflux transporter n=1 Tax=Clostridium ihumii TaxID=1470356 RepID=UPI003D34A058